ncbi:hypothetical protein JCM11251_007558 [Rhodosporidiobolus azoricus]
MSNNPYGGEGYSYPPSTSSAHLAGPGEKAPLDPRSSFAPTTTAKSNKKKWWWIAGAAVAIVVILAAVLGGVLGSRAANDNDNAGNSKSNAAAAGENEAGSSSSSARGSRSSGAGGSSTSSGAGASATPAAGPLVAVTDLPPWNWGQNKSIGMCLGSWLILEKWMLPDWFNDTVNAVQAGSGATALDEWSFTEILGQDRAKEALVEHFNNFVTEEDIQTMYEHGINQIRIPTGFWAWIPTIEGEPYVNDTSIYHAQLERVMSYAHSRGMYVLLDAHGLPGSQNGEQTSGQLTTSPTWFGSEADSVTPNQERSDAMVKAITEFVASSPYRSVVSGIEVINEPRPYTEAQNQQLMHYYERSYATIQASAWPVATFLSEGYINLTYWRDFAAQHATDPPSMVMVDHPYPGNFPPQTDSADILNQVCSAANRYLEYPIPICIDEMGVYTGVKDTAFEKQFLEQQLVTWAWSAGSMYWSFKLIPSLQDLRNGLDYSQYSWSTILANNSDTIPKPSDYGIESTTTLAGTEAFLSALSSDLTASCGDVPSNTAPYSQGIDVQPWAAEVSARTSAQGETLSATSTTASSPAPTATVRRRLVKRAVPMRG